MDSSLSHYHSYLIYSIVCLLLCISSCKSDDAHSTDPTVESTVIKGRTMGTTYRIVYTDSVAKILKTSVDSLLVDINQSVSTYIPQSTISKINNDSLSERSTAIENGRYIDYLKYTCKIDSHFLQNYIASTNLHRITEGHFDPTVMPLVNYWGFGYTPKEPVTEVDSARIESIMSSVGLDKWSDQIDAEYMSYVKPNGAKLDFSAIAKGYAVDEVSALIELYGIKNYIVEIGGEIFCRGHKAKGKPWTIALSKPEIEANINEVQMAVQLNGVGLASSGNYRNYHKVNDKIYGHEINPMTGFPEMNKLLGVSVISPNCMLADAYATAFMVMGLDKSIERVEKLPETEAVFFYASENNIVSASSSGFGKYLKTP